VSVQAQSTPSRPAAQLTQAPEVRLGVLGVRIVLLGIACISIVLDHGFRSPFVGLWVIHGVQGVGFVLYTLDLWLGAWWGRFSLREAGPDWVDSLFLAIGACAAVSSITGVLPWGWRLFELVLVLLLLMELWRLNVGLSRRFYRPGLLLPLSFLAMIAVGTFLLKTPLAVPPGQSISWLDALFTMTSAVCVTGLAVRDTATHFSVFGQSIIAVFIQLGGLGIIIFGSTLAMILGKRLSLRENLSLSMMLNDMPLRQLTSFVRFIVLATLSIELLGAMAMLPFWEGQLAPSQRLGLSLFHSVSAFCNAGFSLFSDSLEGYRYSVLVHLIILPLVVIGGLGFPVLYNLWQIIGWRWSKSRRQGSTPVFNAAQSIDLARTRLTLHTKIVLSTTAGLYLFGVLVLVASQLKPYLNDYLQQGMTANRQELAPLDLPRLGMVLADASFMSVTSRTAGFNSMPMDQVRPAGQFVVMLLMMVGASPGGTGGGMKTTTLALLLLTLAATVRQRDQSEAFGRFITDALIRKAATLAACLIALVCLAILLLSLSEPYPFNKIAFEAVSAATTTGLSLGITADLTGFGKVVIIITMFLGRVGPLALLGALMFGLRPPRPYAYPYETVVIG